MLLSRVLPASRRVAAKELAFTYDSISTGPGGQNMSRYSYCYFPESPLWCPFFIILVASCPQGASPQCRISVAWERASRHLSEWRRGSVMQSSVSVETATPRTNGRAAD